MTQKGQEPARGGVRKYSFTIRRHRTSISLEEPFYTALVDIARAQGKAVAALISEIDAKNRDAGLSSAIRVHVLEYYRRKAKNRERSSGK